MNSYIRILCLFLILAMFTTFNPRLEFTKDSYFFPIKNISVEQNSAIKTSQIKNELQAVKGKNLFFLKSIDIEKLLVKFNFISSFTVKKIYPNSIKIVIIEKKPLALLQKGKKKYFLLENGETINFFETQNYKDLPLIIGNAKNFDRLYFSLKKINFPISEIEKFFYFEIGRWDIILNNDRIIKLPRENEETSLSNFLKVYKNKSFDKYKIFDYRIKNQLILN